MTTHADTHRGAAFVLAWALMASPLALAADTNEALAKLAVAQARKLQNAEQYEKALAEARSALRLSPQLMEGHQAYQDVMGDLGREAQVVGEYRARLKRAPKSAAAHYLCARVVTDLAEKRKLLEEALALDPKLVHAQCALGFLHERQGRHEQAERQFQAARKTQPGFIDALNGLGFLYMNMGRNDAAMEQLQRVVKLDPGNVDAHMNMGYVHRRLKAYDKAIAEFKAVLKADPENPWAQNNLGVCYYRQGRFTEAERRYRRALRGKRYDTPELAHLNLAFVHRRRRHYTLAAHHYQKAIEFKPGFAYAHSQLAQVRYHQKRYKDAWTHLHKAQELGLEPNPEFLQALTKASAAAGR